MMLFGHHSRNPIKRFIVQLLHLMRTERLSDTSTTAHPYVDGDVNLDLDQFLAASPFPVIGLKGRPMGLRLRSAGRSGGNLSGAIDRVRFGYVSGDPYEPEKAVEISQGVTGQDNRSQDSGPGAAFLDLSTIRSLIANYAPRGLREKDPFFRDFHRDWNIKRLENTPRQQATLRVNGVDVEVRFSSWDSPNRVVLARLELATNSLSVSALNLNWDDLREVMSSFVVLLEDQETFAAHQQDVNEAR